VRHCVFILGAAGSTKTQVWNTLAESQSSLKMGGGRTLFGAINPKAITSSELYGYVHPVTKELNDGIIAKSMREFSKMTTEVPKWVVLDGDINAEWIESMNTVMCAAAAAALSTRPWRRHRVRIAASTSKPLLGAVPFA
jgi:dynein heavy chain, axonemal